MIRTVRKRNGEVKDFNKTKIARAIFKAAKACGGTDYDIALDLTDQVIRYLEAKYSDPVEIENIQDAVEKVLIENGHARTAKNTSSTVISVRSPGRRIPSLAPPST